MNENLRDFFQKYLIEEKRKGRKPKGMSGLKLSLLKFIRYLEKLNVTAYEINLEVVLDYQDCLLTGKSRNNEKYSRNTICWYLDAARGFCDYLIEEGVLCKNPFRMVRRLRREKNLPKNIPSEKDMSELLDALSRYEAGNLKEQMSRYRAHVIAELMYASGLRIEEVSNLRKEDIDLQKGIITVKEGKGGFDRTAYLTEYVCGILRLYIEKMRSVLAGKWLKSNEPLLFGTGKHALMTMLNRILERLADNSGLPKITSHYFRHALGTHLLRAGCGIRHIQSILGHKRMRNTEVYTSVEQKDLKRVLDEYHPRQWRRFWHE